MSTDHRASLGKLCGFALLASSLASCSAGESPGGQLKVRDPVVLGAQRVSRETMAFSSSEPPALEAGEARGPNSEATRLVYSNVKAVVRSGSAEIRVIDVVSNDGLAPVDFTYSFPLPSDATVSELAYFSNGKRVRASAQEKTQAKANFEQALARGESATLSESTGNSRFSVAMSPLAPGESRRVELSYVQSLESFGAQRSLTFPAAHSLRRGEPTLDFEVDIEADAELSAVASLNHPDARLVKLDANTERVLLNRTASSLGQDLVVRWTERADPLELSVRAVAGTATEPGFAQVDFAFNADSLRSREPARDFVFVVDTSLSMAGEALEQAKQLVERSLEQLTLRDRLAMIQFDDRLTSWGALSQASVEAKAQALSELRPKRAAGLSNVEAAIDRARELLSDSKNPVLVLVTDGQSTVGDEPDRLLPASKPSDFASTRVIVLLLNYPSRQPQLERLFPQATLRFLPSGDAGRESLRSLAQLVAAPVLEDVQVAIDGMAEDNRYGKLSGRLALGERIHVVGRSNAATLKASVTATLHGQPVHFEKTVQLSERETDRVSVPREWARTKLTALEARFATEPDLQVRAEASKLAQQFGLVSAFTSLLATDALSPDRIAPGDPELRIVAPRGVGAVIAVLPWGDQVNCTWHAAEGLWLGRFLVPRSVADGLYRVGVFTKNQGRTRRRSSLFLRVDSKAPHYRLQVAPNDRGIELTALPEAEVFDRSGDSIRLALVDVKSVSVEITGVVYSLTPTTLGRWQTTLPRPADGLHRVALVATDYAQNSSRSESQITVDGAKRSAAIYRTKASISTTAPAILAARASEPNAPPGAQSIAGVRCWFGRTARRAELRVGGQHVELFDGFLRIDERDVTPCSGLPAAHPIAIAPTPDARAFVVGFRDGTRNVYRAGAFEPAGPLTKAELRALAPPTQPAIPSNVSAGELPSSNVSALATFQGKLVVGSFDGGAFSIDAAEQITQLEGAPRFINALLAEPEALWLASATGLFQLKDGESRELPLGFAASHVNGLARAKDGTLWLATSDGLLGLRGQSWRKLDERQGLPSRIVYAVSEGADGTLWAGTAAGVARIRRDGVETFSVESGALPHRWVTALLADEGGTYVGTYQGGVTRLDSSGASPVPGTGSLWLNPHGLGRLGSRLYAASMGDGLVAFGLGPKASQLPATRLGPLPSTDVTAVKAFAGSLWVGTRAGLARLPQ
ncbi:MAG TPA: VIT domain-containing protein [Polyangiaceae bacterium]|nr:VIT domain-containing protein [Polyangiaceae bacterium]